MYEEAESNASLLAIVEAHQLYVAVRPNWNYFVKKKEAPEPGTSLKASIAADYFLAAKKSLALSASTSCSEKT